MSADSGEPEFSEQERKALRQIARERVEDWPTRRAALGTGAALFGGAVFMAGQASAHSATPTWGSASGQIGTESKPADRSYIRDVHAESATVEGEIRIVDGQLFMQNSDIALQSGEITDIATLDFQFGSLSDSFTINNDGGGISFTLNGTDYMVVDKDGLNTPRGVIYQQRGDPNTGELAAGEAMTYNSDGTGTGSAGDLVYAVNDAGTIKTSIIAQRSNATA